MKRSGATTRSNIALESALAPPLLRWLAAQKLHVRREVATAVGTADMVACAIRSERIRDRIGLGQRRPLGSALRCHIWHQIPDAVTGSSVSFAELRRRYEHLVEFERIRFELARLARDHFVQISDEGDIQKLNGWHPLHDRLVAIEMKLARFEEATAQATNYAAFADEVYVAAPLPALTRWLTCGGRYLLQDRGIGALGVTASRVLPLLSPPHRTVHPSTEYLRTSVVERFWDSVRGNSA